MPTAKKPDTEQSRLASLRALDVLDSAPEAQFNALVHAAAYVAGTPISLLSLVDANRQWFKANIGLPGVTQTTRDAAFCAHTILQEEVLEIQDAQRDQRFSDSPLVAGLPGIRFYAGAPIRLGRRRLRRLLMRARSVPPQAERAATRDPATVGTGGRCGIGRTPRRSATA